MDAPCRIRLVEPGDHGLWLFLWDAYNEFYGRIGDTRLSPKVTETAWCRFLDNDEPMHLRSGSRIYRIRRLPEKIVGT